MAGNRVRSALLALVSSVVLAACSHPPTATADHGDCLGAATGGSLSVVNEAPRSADGMPMLGQTTRDRVSTVIQQKRTDILARCSGAVAVTMKRGPGRAWEGLNGGPYRVVTTSDDYLIVVTLADMKYVPQAPVAYEGIPVRFKIR